LDCLGKSFLENYNPKEAASVFADVLKESSSSRGAGGNRSEPWRRSKFTVQEILRKALEINPNMEQARVALAGIALESKPSRSARRVRLA
jgi:hypothetical protein